VYVLWLGNDLNKLRIGFRMRSGAMIINLVKVGNTMLYELVVILVRCGLGVPGSYRVSYGVIFEYLTHYLEARVWTRESSSMCFANEGITVPWPTCDVVNTRMPAMKYTKVWVTGLDNFLFMLIIYCYRAINLKVEPYAALLDMHICLC
jgi:hypothetical protein